MRYPEKESISSFYTHTTGTCELGSCVCAGQDERTIWIWRRDKKNRVSRHLTIRHNIRLSSAPWCMRRVLVDVDSLEKPMRAYLERSRAVLLLSCSLSCPRTVSADAAFDDKFVILSTTSTHKIQEVKSNKDTNHPHTTFHSSGRSKFHTVWTTCLFLCQLDLHPAEA